MLLNPCSPSAVSHDILSQSYLGGIGINKTFELDQIFEIISFVKKKIQAQDRLALDTKGQIISKANIEVLI